MSSVEKYNKGTQGVLGEPVINGDTRISIVIPGIIFSKDCQKYFDTLNQVFSRPADPNGELMIKLLNKLNEKSKYTYIEAGSVLQLINFGFLIFFIFAISMMLLKELRLLKRVLLGWLYENLTPGCAAKWTIVKNLYLFNYGNK